VIAIDQPPRIESWLGQNESSIPLVEVPTGVYCVDVDASAFSMPQVPVSKDISKLQGFHYKRVTLKLDGFHFIDTKCTGRACDTIDTYHEGVSATQCACYSVISRISQVVMLLSFRVFLCRDGTGNEAEDPPMLFAISNFTSRRFTEMFVVGAIPTGTTSTMIMSDRRFARKAMRSVNSAIEAVNQHNGWAISGWARRGYIRDNNAPSVAAGGGVAGASTGSNQLLSSNLVHHAISVVPNKNGGGELPPLGEFGISFEGMGIPGVLR